ncbi:hypothetical protein PCANC_10770 [Puccinia coronata f. sp. avenae]|uniref:Uncharacterized protein n=1 Tax=Puccinia coronata f. sp. avenae TaxID=200324 RepID=A0A2N5VSN1_9BASI|nr:hypothetical protein PCANC_10770 [Puccinia coronata f. sp. avenae]
MPHLDCLPMSNSPDSPALLNANCLTTNNREGTAVETSQAKQSTQPFAAKSHMQVGSVRPRDCFAFGSISNVPSANAAYHSAHQEDSTSNIPQRFEFLHNRLLFGHAACQMILSPTSSLQPPFPQIGLASTTLFSLINPPTTFLFGGLFEEPSSKMSTRSTTRAI